ncbi:MAG: type II secretion system F family protein [Armatimonadetes bacterium]|nr:type II secretion system F family protein [Armatimonadota bacterium]
MKRRDGHWQSDDGQPIIHLAELAQFTRQLGAMLDAGVEVLRALDVASRQPGNPRLVRVGHDIAAIMADGHLFADAAAQFPDVFSPFYVQMTRQGEVEGVLGAALIRLADYLDQELQRGPGGAGASSVAATGLVAALFGTIGLAILGAAALMAAGGTLQWGEWTAAAAVGWTGLVFMLSAAYLAWRAGRGPSFCISCGRPLPPASGGKEGTRMCAACVRSQVARLKTPERASEEANALAETMLDAGAAEPAADAPGAAAAQPPTAPRKPSGPDRRRIRL